MTTIKSYNIFVNTEYRSSGSPTYFQLKLLEPINLMHPSHYFKVKVASLECPYSFTSINSGNNTVYLRIQRGIIDDIYLIAITPGNYNILTLLAELKSVIEEQYLSAVGLSVPFTLSFDYNRSTSRATLNISGTDSTQTILTLFWSGNVILGEFFGFTTDTILSYNSSNITTSSNYVSTQSVNCSPITSIYLRSENFTQVGNTESIVENKVTLSDIICKIQVSTPPGSYIIYNGDTSIECIISDKSIDHLAMYLTDNLSYNVLDLNGLHFSFRLNIEEIKPDEVVINAIQQVEPDDDKLAQRISELENIRNDILNELESVKIRLTEMS